MNIGRITRVLINKVRHLQISLGHVVRDVDGFARRQRSMLEILLPSSWFEHSRAVLGQVDGVDAVVDGVQCESGC